jgi:Spy/CpxP family protein refolding chaperone
MAAHQMPTTAPGMPHPSAVIPPQYAHSQPQMQPQLHYQHLQKQQLQTFWQQQMQEIEQVNEFRNHQLPLARIKKIMKSDEDVKVSLLTLILAMLNDFLPYNLDCRTGYFQ